MSSSQGKQVASGSRVRDVINQAAVDFTTCWQILADIKTRNTPERERLLDFQPRLASALFNLEEMYRIICAEENRLISRKDRLSHRWFRGRMGNLRRYREALREVAAVGRGIGDSFAWLFYYRQREYLAKHLAHRPIKNMAPGIGGRGELEFLRQIKGVGNSIAIYHGTTTFLRIGDISLFDLKSFCLVGLGELKSTTAGPGKLNISLHLIGPGIREILPDSASTKRVSASDSRRALPIAMRDRLKRQLDAMGKAFEVQKPQSQKNMSGASHLQELESLVQDLRKGKWACRRAGDGLLLAAIRPSRVTEFADTFLGSNARYWKLPSKELQKQAINILGPNLEDNNVIIGTLDMTLLPGTTPIFWWPVDLDFLRSIFFHETMVVTVYNTAHLVRKLRRAGFVVEQQKNRSEPRVIKHLGNRKAVLEGVSYFVRLVSRHLMREDAVVDVIVEALKKTEDEKPEGNLRVEIEMMLNWV